MCTFRLFLIFHNNIFVECFFALFFGFLFCFRPFSHFHSIFMFFVLFEFACFSTVYTQWIGRLRMRSLPEWIGCSSHRWRKCLFLFFFFLARISFDSFLWFCFLAWSCSSCDCMYISFHFFSNFPSFILLWSTCRAGVIVVVYKFFSVLFLLRILLLWLGAWSSV